MGIKEACSMFFQAMGMGVVLDGSSLNVRLRVHVVRTVHVYARTRTRRRMYSRLLLNVMVTSF